MCDPSLTPSQSQSRTAVSVRASLSKNCLDFCRTLRFYFRPVTGSDPDWQTCATPTPPDRRKALTLEFDSTPSPSPSPTVMTQLVRESSPSVPVARSPSPQSPLSHLSHLSPFSHSPLAATTWRSGRRTARSPVASPGKGGILRLKRP